MERNKARLKVEKILEEIESLAEQDSYSDTSEATKQQMMQDTAKEYFNLELDGMWKDCKWAHAVGTIAEIVGGLLTIGAGFMTTSTARSATWSSGDFCMYAGMACGAAGSIANLGTSTVEASITSCRETQDCLEKVRKAAKTMVSNKDMASLLITVCLGLPPSIKKPFGKLVLSFLAIPEDKLESAYEGAKEAGKDSTASAEKTSDGSGKGVKTGFRLNKAILFFKLVFLLFDFIDLGFTIRDLWYGMGSDTIFRTTGRIT